MLTKKLFLKFHFRFGSSIRPASQPLAPGACSWSGRKSAPDGNDVFLLGPAQFSRFCAQSRFPGIFLKILGRSECFKTMFFYLFRLNFCDFAHQAAFCRSLPPLPPPRPPCFISQPLPPEIRPSGSFYKTKRMKIRKNYEKLGKTMGKPLGKPLGKPWASPGQAPLFFGQAPPGWTKK